MAKIGTERTGQVFIEDFDEGIVRSIGAELIKVSYHGEEKETYGISVAGVVGPDEYGGMVPVIFDSPNDAYQKEFLPCVHVARTAVDPAMNRWQSGGLAYRVAAPQAKMVKGWTGEIGPTMVEEQGFPLPYDITYDVHIRSKLRVESQRILRRLGAVLAPYGWITVVDSEGYPRTYDAFQSSIGDLSDLFDVQDREVGWTISVRVLAELDFYDPVLRKTVHKIEISADIK